VVAADKWDRAASNAIVHGTDWSVTVCDSNLADCPLDWKTLSWAAEADGEWNA
jgi:hypothetical protein